MKLQATIFIIGTLILVQVLFLNLYQSRNIENIEDGIETLNTKLTDLKKYKSQGIERIRQLQGILDQLPADFLQGVEDPETKYMEFLDHMQVEFKNKTNKTFRVSKSQQYKAKPIPHYRTDFGVNFTFLNIQEAEKLMFQLLHQNKFKFYLNKFSIGRKPMAKANGTLELSFLVPAKYQIPTSKYLKGDS